jgi:peptidoglycan/xylan/chitin deacetylase (PgdA/CDA1 family)
VALAVLLAFSIFFTAEGRVAGKTVAEGPQATELPIIMYHEVKPQKPGRYSVTPNEFESDLSYIEENGYTTITMTELIDYVYGIGDLPQKPIMLTFDDGYENNYVYAFPLLKKYGMKAVLSIVGIDTDLSTKDKQLGVKYANITWDEINEMIDSGCIEIENHTYDMHSITAKRTGCKRAAGETLAHYESVLSADLEKCQQQITANTGRTPNTFTYPFGSVSEESIPIIKKLGFYATLSCDEGINHITQNPAVLFGLERLPRFHGYTLSRTIKNGYALE